MQSQKVGDSVRLHFLLKEVGPGEPRAERIWVTITQVPGGLSTSYKGTLETPPVFFPEFKINDEVSFEPCHIAQTLIKQGRSSLIDLDELEAFVSNMCLEKEMLSDSFIGNHRTESRTVDGACFPVTNPKGRRRCILQTSAW